MHEVGLILAALEMAFEHTRKVGATRIHRMTLRVGALSGVVPEALQMAFTAVSPGTSADGATLVVNEIAVRCRCERCGEEFLPEDFVYSCSKCGAITSQIKVGRELELASLEVS